MRTRSVKNHTQPSYQFVWYTIREFVFFHNICIPNDVSRIIAEYVTNVDEAKRTKQKLNDFVDVNFWSKLNCKATICGCMEYLMSRKEPTINKCVIISCEYHENVHRRIQNFKTNHPDASDKMKRRLNLFARALLKKN